MAKKMLINLQEPEESRIAVMDGDKLEEYYVERKSHNKRLGNIYKGRVVNVQSNLQAAFVEIGEEKHGFLHASDVLPEYGRKGADSADGKDRRRSHDITQLLKKGQEVLVQVTKDSIGSKAPTLTTYISVPGRYLVLMPAILKHGVSRKIADDETRTKLKHMLQELNPPADLGFIIRTAGIDRTKADLQRDMNYLMRVWKALASSAESESPPVMLYDESDLVIRGIRDILTTDIKEIVVDTQAGYDEAQRFLAAVMPRSQKKLALYTAKEPLFHRFQIEREIEKIHQRRIELPSGGHIVVDQTEALVAIDVNSARFRGERDAEKAAFRVDIEAANEIARQLRLRDLGGLVVLDFIDLDKESNRKELERTMRDLMKKDRARTRVAHLSPFGVMEMTRQRVGPSLSSISYDPCPTCGGEGQVKSMESLGLTLMRNLRRELSRSATTNGSRPVEVRVSSMVASHMLNNKRHDLMELEAEFGRQVHVYVDSGLRLDEFNVETKDPVKKR